jgi:hypothetical protein
MHERYFLGFNTLKWKQFLILENDPEEGGKTLKQSFCSIETVGIRSKEDYFKITSLAGGKN